MKIIFILMSFLSTALAYGNSLCPNPDALNRYVRTSLRAEAAPAQSGLIQIYYRLLRPFDPAKPTMLIINGGPGGNHGLVYAFDNTELSRLYNIVGFDHRGLGCTHILSEVTLNPEPGLLGMDRAADDIEAIRKDLLGPDGKWFVYGLSYGTMLGQKYLIKHPTHISGIILDSAFHDHRAIDIGRKQYVSLFIDAHPETKALFTQLVQRYPELRNRFLKAIRGATYTYSGRVEKIPMFFRKLLLSASQEEVVKKLDAVKDAQAPLLGMMRQIICEEIWDFPAEQTANEYYWWVFNEDCGPYKKHRHSMTFSEELKKTTVPVFIWGGAFDPVTPIQAMREMKTLMPHALFWENPLAGHALFFENHACAVHLANLFIKGESSENIQKIYNHEVCQAIAVKPQTNTFLDFTTYTTGTEFPMF